MSYSYAEKKRAGGSVPKDETAPAQPSLDALRIGAAQPTQEQMGRRVDLPDAMRAKMEDAFGADLSAVKLYESETVADAGANAITQGANIAFAPGMLDFSSYGGQALLGHEISHVVSQARGEATGGGFLNDHALEARADREGAMAAAGQQVAMPAAAMSAVSAAPAAGPMQAKKKKEKPTESTPFQTLNLKKIGKVNKNRSVQDLVGDRHDDDSRGVRPEAADLADILSQRYHSPDYKPGSYGDISNGADVTVRGLGLNRLARMLPKSMGDGYSNDEIISMYDDLMAPHRSDIDPNDREAVAAAGDRFDAGMVKLKEMHYRKLKRMEATYGRLGSQLHPEDFVRLAGDDYNDHFRMGQDTESLLRDAPQYFDFEHNDQDRELRDLHQYYYGVTVQNSAYGMADDSAERRGTDLDPAILSGIMAAGGITPEMEAKVHGPSLTDEQQAAYKKGLQARMARSGKTNRLFGRFL